MFDHNGSKGNYANISSREVTATNQKPPASYSSYSLFLTSFSELLSLMPPFFFVSG